MDRQSTQGGRGGAVEGFSYAEGGGGGGQPEVAGGAFLMELLEDTPAVDQDLTPEDVDDRLSRVMRSLEAEIGCGGPAQAQAALGDGESTTDGPASDDGGLSDFDGSPGACSSEAAAPPPAVPFEYWAEAPAVMGHDMCGWYVDGEGAVAGYEFREQSYYTYGEGSASVEQVYSPLWG